MASERGTTLGTSSERVDVDTECNADLSVIFTFQAGAESLLPSH